MFLSLHSIDLIKGEWNCSLHLSHTFIYYSLACNTPQYLPGIHYSIGKALSFYSPLDNDEDHYPSAVRGAGDPLDWYEQGASHGCPFSALEVWKKNRKPQVSHLPFNSAKVKCGRMVWSTFSSFFNKKIITVQVIISRSDTCLSVCTFMFLFCKAKPPPECSSFPSSSVQVINMLLNYLLLTNQSIGIRQLLL